MAVYEYLCRVCDTRFEARRPMSDAAAPVECPAGHVDTTRMVSVFASIGASTSGPSTSTSVAPAGGGCGSGCACAHG